MHLTYHSKLRSWPFHNTIKPSFRPFVFNFGSKPMPVYLLQVCIRLLGSADGCGAVLHGALALSTPPRQAALLPAPITLRSCIFCYTEDMNHSWNSPNAPWNNEGLLQEHSSFIIHILIPAPYPSQYEDLFLNHKQIKHIYRVLVLLAAPQGHLHCQYIQFGVNKP